MMKEVLGLGTVKDREPDIENEHFLSIIQIYNKF